MHYVPVLQMTKGFGGMGRENEADVCRSHSRLFVPCRGWGLRTLDDIPKGSFVCTYIGHIYTEQGGEEVSCSFTFQVSIPMTATPPCRFCCWSHVWWC